MNPLEARDHEIAKKLETQGEKLVLDIAKAKVIITMITSLLMFAKFNEARKQLQMIQAMISQGQYEKILKLFDEFRAKYSYVPDDVWHKHEQAFDVGNPDNEYFQSIQFLQKETEFALECEDLTRAMIRILES
jgi:pentatricopeptide repeat protein